MPHLAPDDDSSLPSSSYSSFNNSGLIAIYIFASLMIALVAIIFIALLRKHPSCVPAGQRQGSRVIPNTSTRAGAPLPFFALQRGIRSDIFARLPTAIYSTPTLGMMKTVSMTDNTCLVCMSDFASGETIRMLPCRHWFHLRVGSGK